MKFPLKIENNFQIFKTGKATPKTESLSDCAKQSLHACL